MGAEIGERAPDFTLKGTDGSHHTLSEREEEVAVVIFTCNHCPYAQAYEERIAAIENEHDDVAVYCINSNDETAYPEDSYDEMVRRADERELPYIYLRDKEQHIAEEYGATHTPEAYVIDKDNTIRYHGRIDDNWRDPKGVTEHSLRDAIAAVRQGQRPTHAFRPAIGCSIKWR